MKTSKLAPLAALVIAAVAASAAPSSDQYVVERIVEPSHFYGIHGLAFDAQDRLYAGSVVGQSIYTVDVETGAVELVVPPPEGLADDLVFLADGTMVWTSISHDMVRARKGTGPVRVIARDLASVNSINVRKSDGRLFVGQVFGGDGVWELDPAGVKPPRNIVQKPGGFNGFDIGPDGMLYGPLWFKQQVVRIHPDTGEMKVIADGFHTPAAANFDSKGRLYVLDTARGEVVRVDIATGAKQVVARLATSLDNLAIDSRDRIFVSNMADNAIHEVDPETGALREVIKGRLSAPRSIAGVSTANGDEIYVADVFAFRKVDGRNGTVTDIARSHAADTPIGYASSVTANDRHVLLTNSNGNVQLYDRRTHDLLRQWSVRGAQTALELNDGSILVAARGTLIRLSGADGEQRQTILEGLRGSVGLAMSPAGDVYVGQEEAGEVAQLDSSKNALRVIARGLRTPQGLAIDTDGNLFVVERDARQLTRIDAKTGATQRIATDLPVGRRGLNASTSVAAGARGVVYVLSDIENSIYRLTPRLKAAD
ncbi:MAG TPA: SMP-30/gluconolactonase/LRE family protein [Steroidobacteraceae bacterium]|mgnify:CR=1 FL=1